MLSFFKLMTYKQSITFILYNQTDRQSGVRLVFHSSVEHYCGRLPGQPVSLTLQRLNHTSNEDIKTKGANFSS